MNSFNSFYTRGSDHVVKDRTKLDGTNHLSEHCSVFDVFEVFDCSNLSFLTFYYEN